MKKLLILSGMVLLLVACGSKDDKAKADVAKKQDVQVEEVIVITEVVTPVENADENGPALEEVVVDEKVYVIPEKDANGDQPEPVLVEETTETAIVEVTPEKEETADKK